MHLYYKGKNRLFAYILNEKGNKFESKYGVYSVLSNFGLTLRQHLIE